MSNGEFYSSVILGTLLTATLLFAAQSQQGKPAEQPPAPNYTLSGLFTHDNLAIFLIHGDDQVKNKNLLTLDEALEAKKVVVHETKNVNELSIENVSGDEVFIQAGDIVKGGQQDRVLAYDMIVPPKSGKMPLSSFCVEAGRWTGRGNESATMFGSSKDNLAAKDQKIAVRGYGSQDLVWKNVAKAQMALERNVGANVQAPASQSSLQLTLEHKKLLEAVDTYAKKFSPCIEGKNDVIGFAMAINGKIYSADAYASNSLFKKLWPKLIKAACVEAVADLQKDKKFDAPSTELVKTFFAEVEKGKLKQQDVNKRINQLTCETDKAILFDTRDNQDKGACLRRSWIAK